MPNLNIKRNLLRNYLVRSGSRTAATSKMEHFVIIFNGWKPLTIITKGSILDVAAVLDPPLFLTYLVTYALLFFIVLPLKESTVKILSFLLVK